LTYCNEYIYLIFKSY